MSKQRPQRTPLSAVDMAWLHMDDPTNPMVISCLWLFERPLDFARLRDTVEGRLLRHRRFTERVAPPQGGQAFWEPDPHFTLAAHLHRVALPGAGDDAELQELVGDMMSAPLDFDRSPWQMHLIERYGAGCALLMRLHHCVADGMVLKRVLLSLTDPRPDPAPEPPNAAPAGPLPWLGPALDTLGAALHTGEALLHEGWETITHPQRAIASGALGVAALGKLLLMPPDHRTALKGPLGTVKRAAWTGPLALDEIKAAGRAMGATVNDVLLAAVSGALRRYLRGRGEPVDGALIRAMVPVNLLPPGAVPESGNHFGLVFAELPVASAEPLARLAHMRREMAAIKSTPEAALAFSILGAVGASPSEVERVAVDIFGAKVSLVITNVPGPREPLYLAGERVAHSLFLVPQAGRLGLGVSILSYDGSVRLGVASDAGIMPEPGQLVAAFEAELAELVALCRDAGQAVGA